MPSHTAIGLAFAVGAELTALRLQRLPIFRRIVDIDYVLRPEHEFQAGTEVVGAARLVLKPTHVEFVDSTGDVDPHSFDVLFDLPGLVFRDDLKEQLGQLSGPD